MLVWALHLHPATPGWGARRGCVCFGSGCGCTPPLLTGVLGCVCAGVNAPLHPATPGWVPCRGCVCLGSGFGCTPPLLAGVLGCVCAGVGAPLAPRHSWLGCAPWVCVSGLGLRLHPATPDWGVGLCVCWCGRSACTPPLLAGVRAVGVCVWARVSAAPRHSWLGCWGVCVLVCVLLLYLASPRWGVRLGCVCLGSGFGCAPPLLAGVLGCVCARVRAPLATCHSWLGCAVCVCVFGLGFLVRPTTPGWAVRCGCVCSGSGFGCAPPLLAGVCGVWVGCCLAPVRVPWFVACCARSPGLWHPATVAAWHLSVCPCCGRRRASLACLVAPRGAPRLVRSGCSRCSGRLSRRRGAFRHPGGLRPRLYWAAARGTRRPAENRAHCACRWPPPRRGRWARSASYPFGAPRCGCPWRVTPALVLGCVRCGGWRVWTRSLTRPVSRTVRRSTGDLAGAPGLFRVDAYTASCGSEDATPGSRACVRVLALLGRVGRAGLPGAFWCASPFPLAALAFCFALPPLGWGCPRLGPFFLFPLPSSARPLCLLLSLVSGPGCPGPWRCVTFVLLASRLSALRALSLLLCCPPGCCLLPGGCLPPPPFVSCGFSCRRSVPCVFFSLSAPPLSLAFSGFRPRVPWALALCFAFFFPPASRLSVRSPFLFSCLAFGCSLVLGTPPLPLCLAGFVAAARCPCPPFFFVSLCAPPLSLAFSGFRPRVPWALALCFVCFVCLPLLGSPCALSFFCVSPGRWLLPGGCCPPPPLPLGVPFFFFLRCSRLSLVSGPGCIGPRRCALFALLASRFSASRAFSPLSCLPSGRWLLPSGRCPPPLFVSRGFCLVARVCRVLCCAVCPGLRCCAALLRVVWPGVVLLCAVLFCCAGLVPLLVVPCPLVLPVALGPCALRRCVLRCSPALCVFCRCVVVCVVVRRSALCCVCPGVLCCAFPVLSALCGAVLRCAGALALCCLCGACCCWRPVLWCTAVCCAVSFGVLWCGAGSGCKCG